MTQPSIASHIHGIEAMYGFTNPATKIALNWNIPQAEVDYMFDFNWHYLGYRSAIHTTKPEPSFRHTAPIDGNDRWAGAAVDVAACVQAMIQRGKADAPRNAG